MPCLVIIIYYFDIGLMTIENNAFSFRRHFLLPKSIEFVNYRNSNIKGTKSMLS